MIDSVEKHYNRNGQFIDYKMTLSTGVIWYIPLSDDNTDYHNIQEWAKIEGNNIIDNGA